MAGNVKESKMNYIDFFQPGGTVNPVLGAASYMIPIYGTYRSIKDAIAEPTWQNIGLAGASALGDALTVFGVGAGIKSGVAGARAAKAARTLAKAADAAHATASNIARISDGATKAATKTKQAVNAATLLPEATQSQIIALQKRASAASDLAWHADAARRASAEIPTTLFDMSTVKAAEAARKTNQAKQWYKAAGATTLGSSAFDAAGQSFKNGGYIDFFKNGSGIHIKKKNRGKFTASAKAAGESVQEHAHKVMNDPNATTLQKKRANFAIQAKRWAHKHQTGGIMKGANGLKTSTTYFSAVHPEFNTDDLSSFSMETRLPRVVGITPDYLKQYDIPVIETEAPVEESVTFVANAETPAAKPTTKKSSAKGMHKDLVDLQDLFTKYNVPIKITSGYREGATTSSGKRSYHATGEAMDIVPTEGHSFKEISDMIRNTPEIANFMKQRKIGVLDETSKEMLARTGGTGAHFHIGRDNIAQRFWS